VRTNFYLVILFVFVCGCRQTLFVSCADKKQQEKKIIIVDKFQENEIDLSDIISDIHFIILETKDDNLIGNISDLCVINDTLYIWDNLTSSVFSFYFETGQFIKKVSHRGNGPNEYMNPIAITNDSSHIFLLDMPTNHIICLDRELEKLKTIHIPIRAADLISTGNGFLLSNLGDNIYTDKLVLIDYDGNIMDSFFPLDKRDNPTGSIMLIGDRFTKSSDKVVYFSDSHSNKIYALQNNEMSLAYELDFLAYNLPNDLNSDEINLFEKPYAFNVNFFALDQKIIFSFFKNENRYYGIYDLNDETFKAGKIKDKKANLPFFPQWQVNDYLIGICPVELLESYSDSLVDKTYEEDDIVLIRYSLK
jgi:hypothetical protein